MLPPWAIGRCPVWHDLAASFHRNEASCDKKCSDSLKIDRDVDEKRTPATGLVFHKVILKDGILADNGGIGVNDSRHWKHCR